MSILIVDDSSVMRRILMNTLKRLGYDNFIEAEHGAQALEKWEQGGVSIIFTDWLMPVMDGLDLVKAIRAKDLDLPIIMVTAKAAPEDIIVAIQAGATNYIVKPFTPKTLEAKLNDVFAQGPPPWELAGH